MLHPSKYFIKLSLRLLTLALCSLEAAPLLAMPFAGAYPGPSKGECNDGYTNKITEPADVVAGTLIQNVKEIALPSNICMRWSFQPVGAKHYIARNFSKSDFVVITASLTKADFNVGSYEPIIGHYTKAGHNYVASAEPRADSYNDYTGAHPILINKDANASVRFIGGKYYIDKKTFISGPHTGCPFGFSTVGESNTCYSKRNGLRLNADNKLELIEFAALRLECPQGYSTATGLGSDNGICTSTLALKNGIAKSELWNPWFIGDVTCKQGEYTENGIYCMPALTAVYCEIDAAAQSKLTNYRYNQGRHVFYWPTKSVDVATAKIDFNANASKINTGTVGVANIRNGLAFFNNDKSSLSVSGLDGYVPAFLMYASQTCDKLVITGTTPVYPLPTF
jgi:hypothetical protein